MRIISGKFRGKKFAKSDHLKSTLRPTTDKAREALFNLLSLGKTAREFGFDLIDSNVLDVCCGTGAVGFESLSRGAKFVTFIDNNRKHLEIVEENARILGVEDEVEILNLDAKKLPANNKIFDLVFLDPPYADNYEPILARLVEGGYISEKTLLVVESQSNSDLPKSILENLELLEKRSCGRGSFYFLSLK